MNSLFGLNKGKNTQGKGGLEGKRRKEVSSSKIKEYLGVIISYNYLELVELSFCMAVDVGGSHQVI